jgi:transcriptional regulator of acetoin/glycerol metabolism
MQLHASWERSRHFGVHPERVEPVLLSESELHRRRDMKSEFLHEAERWITRLYTWVKQWGALVLTADADGVILDGKGDPGFIREAARVHLATGSDWSESVKGTNAIGTAATEQRAVAVVGSEHYCQENHFLSCAASPVFGPDGKLMGVIDVSTHASAYHPSLLTLADFTAQTIEEALLWRRAKQHLLARVMSEDRSWQAVVAVDSDGRIRLGTRGAYTSPWGSLVGQEWEKRFDVSLLQLTNGTGRHVVRDQADGSRWIVEVIADQRSPKVVIPTSRGGRYTGDVGRHMGNSQIEEYQFADATKRNRLPSPSEAQLTSQRTKLEGWVARYTFDDLLGTDHRFLKALRMAQRVAVTDEPVLILGETGTGKEMLAHAIHRASRRSRGPFVAVNCGAIPHTLRESEWFGYEKGAFTGANEKGQPGKFELANGGTLFLDEIGDMPLEAQGALLRVLQEKEVVRLGGRTPIRVDVRIVAATNRDLWKAVQEGKFRADLFYRLQGMVIELPPLRDRSDRVELAELLLQRIAMERAVPNLILSESARILTATHPWPGNVRQLLSALRQAAWEAENGVVELHHFPEWVWKEWGSNHFVPQTVLSHAPTMAKYQESEQVMPKAPSAKLADLERDALLRTLNSTGWNKSRAAQILGISRSTLYRKLQQLEATQSFHHRQAQREDKVINPVLSATSL